MDMNTLLGSAVIAAIISGMVAITNNLQNNKLKYITEERTKWRESIREIAQNLCEEEDESKIKLLMVNLKVRINPYGYYNKILNTKNNKKEKDESENRSKKLTIEKFTNKNKQFLKDKHIYQCINNIIILINTQNYNKVTLENKKEELIDYLSLLLKYDWERVKKEADSTTKKHKFILFIIYFLVGFIIYSLIIDLGYITYKKQPLLVILAFTIYSLLLFVILELTYIYYNFKCEKKYCEKVNNCIEKHKKNLDCKKFIVSVKSINK